MRPGLGHGVAAAALSYRSLVGHVARFSDLQQGVGHDLGMTARMAGPAAVVKPMLATSAPPSQPTDAPLGQFGDDWVFEPKLDGFRCLMHVVDGRVVLRSRTGGDLTQRFSATPLPTHEGPLIIDGELIAVGEDGRPSFNLVQRANGRPGDPTASYVAFDLLYHHELGDIRDKPWATRRELLEALQPHGLTVIPYSPSGSAMWETVLAQDFEGAMAKRNNSTYRSGRTGDWLKVKRVRELSAIATGFNEGTGSRSNSFGSLALALIDAGGELIRVGDVGTGFDNADLAALKALEPPFVVEVRYQEWTGTALRMPVFKGVREDVPLSDCTFERQLPEAVLR